MFKKKDISTEFIYRFLDSDKPTSELLNRITEKLQKKVNKTLWNTGVVNESTGQIEFIKKNGPFLDINEKAIEAADGKKGPQIIKTDISDYKYCIAAPLKYRRQKVGVLVCLAGKKYKKIVEKTSHALAIFIKQHNLDKKLIDDAIIMNTIINVSQSTSSEKNIKSLVKTLLARLKEFLNTTGARIYMKNSEDDFYFYDETGISRNFEENFENSLVNEIFKTGRPRMVNDINSIENYKPAVDDVSPDKDTLGIIAAPLLVKEKVVGVLILTRNSEKEVFVGSDLVWTKTIAGEIAATYERLKLYKDLHKLFLSSIDAMAAAIDSKDPYTHGHSRRVTMYAILLGKALNLNDKKLENLRLAAQLHDIGKIAVPENILTKEEKLTDQEWRILKEHPQKGADILNHVKEFEPLIPGIKHHHERWAGDGYPSGLRGEDIPYFARIISVADAFDAMLSRRIYRKAMSEDEVLQELKDCSGTQFDPELADIFIKEYKEKFYGGQKVVQ